jgi:small GTP-binding protein
LVGLIGLPNSGKSSLLNRLTGTKKAIVAKEAHTTRDLNFGEEIWDGMYIRFVDTGGLVPDPSEKIQKAVQVTSWAGIAKADLLVWVIDRKQDPDTISQLVLEKIWKIGKPLILCINKVDDPNFDKDWGEYAKLGGVDFVNVSANTGYNLNTMLDKIVYQLQELGFANVVPTGLASVDNQKPRQKRKVPKEVRKHRDGGYYVVRDEDGLYESVPNDLPEPMEDAGEFDDNSTENTNVDLPKILLLGKPNVGKSSLFNALFGQDIQIVTDIPGTTLSVNDLVVERPVKIAVEVEPEMSSVDDELDYVDSEYDQTEDETDEVEPDTAFDDADEDDIGEQLAEEPPKEYTYIDTVKKYILLDTTGIRRPGQRTFGAESFATFRTIQAAHEADVVVLILDGSVPLSHQDQVVAGICKEVKKGLVVLANKADVVDLETRAKFARDFGHKFEFLKVDSFLWISAEKPGRHQSETLNTIWEAIDHSLSNREKQIEREEVRRIFNYLMRQKPPAKLRNKKKPVVYDLLYVRNRPPTFELLVKDKTTIHWSYMRFLENLLRRNFDFSGTEIVVKLTEVDRRRVVD